MSRLSLKNDFKDGDILYGEQLNTNNDATMEAVNDNYEKILSLQELKEDVVNVDSKLEGKVDVTTFNDAVNSINSTKADKSEVALKADKSELANKADISYVNNQLTNKADVTYVNTQMNTKADKSALGDLNSLKTNTKTSAVAAINELVDNGSGIKDIDNISITKNANEDIQAVAVMNRNNTNKAVRTWTGTREEYDALENKDANTLYYITDEPDDYEVKANKTLTINELSTDEQYPSAKAVYNSLKEKVDATYVSDAVANKVDKDTYNTDMADKVDTSVIGDLSELNTPDKDSIVGAINSIETQDVSIATADSVGVVKPDGTTTTVDADGTLHAVGGGAGGTSDYNALENKPSINGVVLSGDKSSSDLGIKQDYTANDIEFDDGETFQQKYDAGELTGPKGDTGAQGPAGTDGNDATINGQNAINLVAGENIDIAQDGSNVTISSTGGSGGATYTAGTNIEITEDNVINNTMPYVYNSDIGRFLLIENASLNTGKYVVGVGYNLYMNGSNNVSVGMNNSLSGEYNVALGGNLVLNNYENCVLLGYGGIASSDNQFVLGSTRSPINEMKVVTSDGDKYIATTDQLTTDTTPKVYSITPENNSEENPFVFSENPTGLYLISTPTIYYKDFPENTVVSNEINYPGVLFYNTKLTSDIEIEGGFVTIATYYTFNMTDSVQEYIEDYIRFYKTNRMLNWGATNNIISITPLNYTNKVKLPAGGTTGQILMKNSDTDYDCSWTSLDSYDEVMF